jgi:hypothetical protein
VLYTDPTGKCVPDEESPRACRPTFSSSLRNFLRYSYGYEQRAYRGGDAINIIFDQFPEQARTYQAQTDQALRAFLGQEGFEIDPTIAYISVRLTQWRQDDAQQTKSPTPDIGPMAAGLIILGIAAGGPDCFLSPTGSSGGGAASSQEAVLYLKYKPGTNRTEFDNKLAMYDYLARRGKLIVGQKTPRDLEIAKAYRMRLRKLVDMLDIEPAAKKQLKYRINTEFDVDHIHDLQLGGPDLPQYLRLGDKSVGSSLGSQIQNQTRKMASGTRITRVVEKQ